MLHRRRPRLGAKITRPAAYTVKPKCRRGNVEMFDKPSRYRQKHNWKQIVCYRVHILYSIDQ